MDLTTLGIDPNGNNVYINGVVGYYGYEKCEVIDAFTTSLWDESGAKQLTQSEGRDGLNDHTMYIAIPLDGTTAAGYEGTKKYDLIRDGADAIRVLYQVDGSSDWYDYHGAMQNDGTSPTNWTGGFVTVNFSFQSNVTKVVVMIDRAGAVYKLTDHRSSTKYNNEAYQAVAKAIICDGKTLSKNVFIDVEEVPTGDDFEKHENASGIKNNTALHYNDNAWTHDVEVVKVVTSETPYDQNKAKKSDPT